MLNLPDDPMAVVAGFHGIRLFRFAAVQEVAAKWRPSPNRSWMYLCECSRLFWPDSDEGVLFPNVYTPVIARSCRCTAVEPALRIPLDVCRPSVPDDFDSAEAAR